MSTRDKCIATSNRTGQRCGRYPIRGGIVCPTHGGSIRHVRVKAAERLAEDEAAKMVERMNIGPVDDPIGQLKLLAGRALAWEQVFAAKREEIVEWRYTHPGAGEQLRSEVAVVERAMDRVAHILVQIAKLNLDERIVRIEEARGALVEQLVLGVFADLRLTPEQIREGRVSFGRRLLAISA